MRKPSEWFMDNMANWQDLSVKAEISGHKLLQKLADIQANQMLKYAAIFRMVGL